MNNDNNNRERPPVVITKKRKFDKANVSSSSSSPSNSNSKKCSICNKVKDIKTSYSKNQRRKGENAKCKDCIDNLNIESKKKAKIPVDPKVLKEREEEKKRKAEEKAVRERKEREEYQRELERNLKEEAEKKKTEKRNRDRLRIGYYENLCHDILDSNADVNKKKLQFKSNINTDEQKKNDLIGTYDIIYYAALCGGDGTDCLMSRNTKGTLTLSWKERSDNIKVIHGEVKIDPEHAKDTGIYNGRFQNEFIFDELPLDKYKEHHPSFKDEPIFEEEEKVAGKEGNGMKNKDCFIPFVLKDKENGEDDLIQEENMEGNPIPAKIKIISERNALGRRGKEEYIYPGDQEEEEEDDEDEEEEETQQQEKKKSIPFLNIKTRESKKNRYDVNFETLQEAEEIHKKYISDEDDDSYSQKEWLCTQKSLPVSTAKAIHECISYKPPPIFFIEQGDIHLDVTWLYDVYDFRDCTFCNMVLLARKRGKLYKAC